MVAIVTMRMMVMRRRMKIVMMKRGWNMVEMKMVEKKRGWRMVVMKRADHKFRDQWREADSAIEAPLQPFFFSILSFSALLSPFVFYILYLCI